MRTLAGICAALSIALPSIAFADAVYSADLSFSAVALVDGLLAKQKVSSDALVNLARGRGPEEAVPANETMALVFDCTSGEASLTVFDVAGGTVLVTWATSGDEDLLLAPNGGAFGFELDVSDVGNANNGIDDGYLVVTAQFKPGPGNCPSGIKATASGVLEVTVTDDVGTQAITAALLKGKAAFSSAPIDELP